MATFGLVTLQVAFGAALVSIATLLIGHVQGPKKGESLTNVGYIATFVAAGVLTISILIMTVAFFREDFTLQYVAENHSTDVSGLSWLYKLSGVWAGRQGSFLFWTWLVSVFTAFIAWKRMEVTDALSNIGIMISNVVLALFSVGMLFSKSNAPFTATQASWIDPTTHKLIGEAAGFGMNPLLEHWAMTIHPPVLFIGYAGMTIPFAFALAALIVKDGSSAWIGIVDRVTVFSWLFLGAGIGLGAIWAYAVLGWGGYWGWDPVESGSLLPWLTGVALVHSMTVYKRRDGFKRWAILLASVTFSLVVLGTFITRSGIVQSAHTFEADPVSYNLFLSMILGSIGISVALLIARWDAFAGNDEFEALTSKEGAYYFNNVIMLVAAVLVAYLTISPAIPKGLPFGHTSVPPATYDAVARPVGVVYLAILAFCPFLAWRRTDWTTVWKRMRIPLAAAAVIFALLIAEWVTTLKPIYDYMVTQNTDAGKKFIAAGPTWYYHTLAILGFLVASVLIANTVWLFIDGARKRSEARGEGFFAALWSILTKARGQSGGYLAHIGMGIIMIGLIGSAMYVQDETVMVQDKPGTTFKMADYTFTYQGVSESKLPNGNAVSETHLVVSRNGKRVGTMNPGMTVYTNLSTQSKTRLDAKMISNPLRDIFVVFQGGANDNQIVFNVKVNPLIWFTWGGFILLLFGTGLAAWPRRALREVAPAGRAKAA
jgi:cytochrome c-type biogenesis protein CcmF